MSLSEDNVCVSFVVITIQFLPHSKVVTGIVKRVIRRLRHVEEKLPTLPEQCVRNCLLFRSNEFNPGFWWCSLSSIFSFVCSFVDRCLSFCPFNFGHCTFCSSFFELWLLISSLASSHFS